jgi:hypothetical protein
MVQRFFDPVSYAYSTRRAVPGHLRPGHPLDGAWPAGLPYVCWKARLSNLAVLAEDSRPTFLQMETKMKNSMRHLRLVFLVVVSVIGALPRAEAGFVNHTIHGEYLFPNSTNDYQDLGTQQVNPTASFSYLTTGPENTVTVYDTYLTLTTDIPVDYKTSAAFNGFGLIDTSGNLGANSFVVDPSTNVPGFVLSDVTLSQGEILINIEGLELTSSETIKLDFTFNSSVPEPSSLALCGIAGSVALAASWRRRRNTA